MSEAMEKVLKFTQIPIFPLPVVLFPNEILPLHIFEPRYRKMVKDIQFTTNNLFGVSYLSPETSISPSQPIPMVGTIGCVAEMREIQMLPDGRSNILTIGVVRYRIEEYVKSDEPYLVASVSYFEDDEEDVELLKPIADEVFELFVKIARMAHEFSREKGELPELPQTEPQTLSFLIGAAFNLPAEEKYELLKLRSTSERLQRLREKLKEIIERVKSATKIAKVAQTNGHGQKKIDIE
jgi:Lon protease-like protein